MGPWGLTNISTPYTYLGLTDARVGDTSRGNQNIQDIKCEFKDTIVLTCVGDRIILSRDKFEMEDIVEMPKLCPGNFEIICEGALSKLLCVGRIDFSIKFGCIMTQPFLIEGIIEAATWREIPVPNQLLVLFLVVLRRGLSGRAVGILNVELGIQSGLYSIGIWCQFDKFTNYNEGSAVLA